MGLTVFFSSHLSVKDNEDFKQHIKKTCGVNDVEIICFENKNKYSLTQAYNIGLNNSKNDIVVFVHNDIIFETPSWGKKILNHFKSNNHGILGVAGTTDLVNGQWWASRERMIGIVNHLHEGKKFESKYSNSFGDKIIDVAVIDGLFIAVDKTKLKSTFDERFDGFHFYDIPFCVANKSLGVDIGVIFDVRLTHKSVGQTNQKWEENKLKFEDLYKELLPIQLKVEEIELLDKPIQIKTKNGLPKVTVIIPTKDNLNILLNCLDSFKQKVNYDNYNIVVADTGSSSENIEQIEEYLSKTTNIRLVKFNYYNFAKINNEVVKKYIDNNTKLVLFCNNDVQLLNDAVTRCVDIYLKNPRICGTIGIRLHFADNSIQHSGILGYMDREGRFGLSHVGLRSYYNYINDIRIGTFGNTGAFLMMEKALFDKIGGFNENYIECLEDVELNCRCLVEGRQNIFVGNAVAYHFESLTRNLDVDKNKRMSEDFNKNLAPFLNQNIDKIRKYIKSI